MTSTLEPIYVINELIRKFGYRTYLEVGVQRKAHNFDLVTAPVKEGVDIDHSVGATYTMRSDEFFERGIGEPFYDCIYVDADHRLLPALRDIGHALMRLAPGGTLVCDNILPASYEWTRPGESGQAWLAWAYLRMSRPDLSMWAVDIAYGCGVIRRGKQALFVPEEMPYVLFMFDMPVDWNFYCRYRAPLMNIVTADAFLKELEGWQ